MTPIPVELRERICKVYASGKITQQEVANRFLVSRRTVQRVLAKQKHGESLMPGKSPGRPPKLSDQQRESLRRSGLENPDATLEERRRELGLSISIQSICRELKRRGFSRKKVAACR